MNVRSSGFRYLAIVLINALFWHPVLVLAEGIVVSPGAGNTRLDRAGNGVPIIDIATPNGRGLSHNTFSDYNVDQQGVVLNNATDKWQETQLAGQIVGNPNLRDRAAKLIVNEVNGGNPSRLAGYTEVAGAKANVVVANPYGISCDGCGFINSPRVTLSTGKPVFDNGELDHYAVDRGSVSVEGLGLDATQVDQFDIITRAARINADIHAHGLDIVTGANDVDADTLQTRARKGNQARPELAIDSSALGGMYADRISLVGTEAGVGVRVAGDMAASAGDILIDAAGHLELSDTQASRRVAIEAASAETTGRLRGEQGVAIDTRGDMALYSNVSSAGDISLEAGGKITQRGEVIAGVEDSQRLEGRRLTVRADRIDNHGRLDATQQLKIDGRVTSNHGQLLADEVAVHADRSLDNRGAIRGQRTVLETAALHNEGTIAAKETLDLRTPQITNRGLLRFGQGQDVSLAVERLDNADGQFQLDAAALTLDASSLINDAGVIHAERLSLSGQDLSNRKGGLIDASTGDARLDFTGRIDNDAGRIQAWKALTLDADAVTNRHGQLLADAVAASAVSFDNAHGLISSQSGNAAISVTQDIDNTQGSIEAQGALDLTAASLHNAAGRLLGTSVGIAAKTLNNGAGTISAQQGDLNIRSPGKLDNSQGHLQAAQGAATIVAGTFINRGGDLLGRGLDVSINHSLNNTAGRFAATTDTLALDVGGDLDNTHGELRGQSTRLDLGALTGNAEGLIAAEVGDLDLTTRGDLNSATGRLQAQQDLTLVAGRSIDNSSGNIVADRVEIAGIDLRNHQGVVSAETGDLGVKLGQRLDNSDGHLQAVSGNAHLDLGSLSNQHGVVSARAVNISTRGNIDNGSGHLTAGQGALVLDSAGALGNVGGSIDAGDEALRVVTAGALDNTKGVLRGGAVNLEVGELTRNRGGLVSADSGDLELVSPGTLDNTRGRVIGQSLVIEALSLDNQEGLLSADSGSASLTVKDAVNNVNGIIQAQDVVGHSDRIQLQSTSLDNRKGRIIAGEIEAAVHGDLDNSEGVLLADKRFLNLSVAGELLNRRGGVQAKNGLQLTAATLNNDLGSLLASVLELHAEEDVSNVEGEVLATQGGLSLVAGADIDNTGGKLVSNRYLTLIGKDFTNQEGLITTVSGNAEMVSKGKADNRGGTLQIAGALVLSATQAILNESGSLIAGALDLAGEELSNDSGIVSSEHGPLQMSVQRRLSNVDGVIQTGKDSDEILGIDAGSIDNRSGRMIAGSLQLAGHDGLDNSQGELIADLGSIDLKTGGNSDLLNVDGTIQAFSLLDIDAGNWNNTSGTAFGRHVEGNVQNLANLKSGLIVASDGPLVLKANGIVENVGGRMQTAEHLGLDVARLDNRDGVLLADTLQVAGEFLDNTQGVLSSIGDMTLLVSDVFDNTTGNINTRDGSLTIKGPSAFTNKGGRLASPRLELTVADVDNRRGELISDNVDITAVILDNREEGLISADAGDLSIAVDNLDNRNGQLQARDTLSVSSESLDNSSGTLVANQVSVDTDTLDNNGGVISAETGSLSLQVFGTLNNVGGYLQALSSVVDLATGTFDNSKGTLLADTIDFLSQGDVRNQGGRISARRGNLTLEAAGNVDNTRGAIRGDVLGIRAASMANSENGLVAAKQGGVTLELEGNLDNTKGIIQAQNDAHASGFRDDIVQVQANGFDNRHGRVVAGEVGLVLDGDLDNTQGVLLADRAIVTLDADGQLNNRNGAIEGKSARISGNSFDNSGGYVGADEGMIDLLLEGSLINEQGQIQAQDGLTLRVDDLNNDHGKLAAASLSLFIDRELSNHGGGILASDHSLLIDSQGSLDNTGGTLAATGKLELLSGSLINPQGVIASASGDAVLTSQSNIDNGDGRLQAAGELVLDAGATILNSAGIITADVVHLAGRAFDNTLGIVSSAQGPLSLLIQKGVVNRGGTLQAGAGDLGRLFLAAGSVDNRKGRMVGGVLDLGTQNQWDNRQGELIADRGKLNLDVANGEVLLNREGHIRAATGLDVIAGSLNNDAGLAVGSSVDVHLRRLVNRESGLIGATDGPLNLHIEKKVDNRGGQLQAVGSMSLETGQLDNTHGVLLSDTLRIHSDELNNIEGVLSSLGELDLRVSRSIDNSSGRILSQNGSVDIRQPKTLINADGLVSATHLELMMDDLDNRRGQLIGDRLELHGGKIDNSDYGLIAAGGDGMLIDTGSLDNSNGRLQADGRLDVQTGTLNNTEGVLLADGVRLTSNGFVNDQGAILGGKDGVTLKLDGFGNNRHGVIDAQDGTLQISSDDQTLDNRGGSLSGQKLTLSVDRLDNRTNGQIAGRRIELDGLSRLDNRSGRIIADKGALMLGAATIDNRGGLIQGDSVNLQGDLLDNGEGGLLSSLQGLLKIVLGDRLRNVAGRILANGMLDIDPPLVDNTNGQIAGEEIALNAGRLVNTGGIVEAQSQLRVDAGSIANGNGSLRSLGGERSALKVEATLDNRNGEIGIGSRDFQLETGDLRNSLGTVLHAGKGLFTLLAGSLNNRDGNLQGTASASFNIDQLAGTGRWQFNDALALETEGSLKLDSGESIESAGDLTLAAMGIDNDGELLANGDIDLTSRGDLVNSGTISSQAGLNVVARNLSQAEGRLASGDDSTYRLTGRLDNLGRLVAGGNIDIKANDINNRGTLGSQQDLRIVSRGGIDNNADTLLFSGGDMTLRSKRLNNVYGDIYSLGSFDFALDDQQVLANRFENRSGNIHANGNIVVRAKEVINSKNEFEVGGGDDLYKATLEYIGGMMRCAPPTIIPLAGSSCLTYEGKEYYGNSVIKDSPAANIEGGGIFVFSENFNNANSWFFSSGDLLINTAAFKNSVGIKGEKLKSYKVTINDRMVPVDFVQRVESYAPGAVTEENFSDSDYQEVFDIMMRGQYAGGYRDEVIIEESGDALNQGGIQAVGKVTILTGEGLENGGITKNTYQQLRGGLVAATAERPVQYLMVTAGKRRVAPPEESSVHLPSAEIHDFEQKDAVDSSDTLDLHFSQYKRSSIPKSVGLELENSQGSAAASRNTLAEENNIASVDYVKKASVNESNLDNVGLPASSRQRKSMPQRTSSTELEELITSQDDYSDEYRQGKVIVLDGNGNSQNNDADDSLQKWSTALDKSVDVSGDSAGESENAMRSLAEVDLSPVDYHGVEFKRVSPASLSSFRLPRGDYGLFVKSAEPKSHYLIETNPEFTAVENVIGSDYLLDKLDYSDDSAYQLLGDGRYESRLIRDAIQASTGSRFLDERLGDDYQQYRYLMDNTIAAQDALQLTVGVGLTPEQTAALTHDIVWLESQEIDGETVLAPVLYLAQVDERNVRGGSLIQGRDIDLIAGGDLINVGTIKAANDLTMKSGGSILQGGLIEAGNRLDMSAVEDIRNAASGEIRGSNVSLETLRGDIVNDRVAVSLGYEYDYETYLEKGGLITSINNLNISSGRDLINLSEIESGSEVVASAARDIVFKSVGDSYRDRFWFSDHYHDIGEGVDQHPSSFAGDGDVFLSAGRNITISASRIDVGGDFLMDSVGGISIGSMQNVANSYQSYYDKRYESKSVGQVVSHIAARGDVGVTSGGDVSVNAGEIYAGGDLFVFSKNDIDISSQANRMYERSDESSARNRKSITDSTIRQQGSELSAGGDLSLIAGNDLTAQASRLKAGDQVYLVGGNDVSLVAANDEDYHYYYKKKKSGGLISRKSMKRDEVTDTRAVGTTVETGGDLTIASGGNQTYEAARLDSGGDLSLTSGGGITFAGALDTHTESHEKSKSNWAWQSAKGKGQTDQTLRQNELLAQGQTLIQAADGLNIDISQVDQQTVSQAIDAMVTANPDLAWLEQAEARGDIDWRTVKEIHDSWDYSQSGLGQGAALAISIAAAAIAGPAAAGAVSAIGGGGLAAAMAAGAAGSLAGTAAVGVINHRGNLGATFSDTLSSDSLKSAVTAAASAGVAKGLDSVWGGSTDPVTGQTVGVNLDSASGWGRFAGQRASQALADAGIDTAVQGGSFGDHFRTRLQNATSTVLQATLFNQVGNLGLANDLADGGSEKVALHALAGGLAAAASGGDFKSGALAAGANEALVEQLATLVDNDPQLLTAASQITGIVAAGLADGDVQQGAEIAGNATTYNRLMHADEQTWIKEHADSKEEQARLTAAACALIECSAQFDKDSDQYAYFKQMETLGGSEAYAQEKQKLQTSGLFTYSRWNGLTDGMSRYQVGNRAMGAVQVFNGTAAAIAGSALAGTGLGSALGGLMLGWGADNAAAGTLTAFNGQPTPTFGAQALQQAGISPEVAGAIYDLAGMAGAAGLVKSGINPANVVDEVVNSSSKNTGAYNIADAARLRTQLISQEISSGHGFEKHVLQQGEFSSLGIKTRQQYASHIEDVLHHPSSVRYTVDGRVFYLQESTGTVVVRNPRASDGGTAFQPRDWNDYIAQLPSRTEPY